jgi:hypothetical protein
LADISKADLNGFVKWCIDWEDAIIQVINTVKLDKDKTSLNKENVVYEISPEKS